MLKRSFSSILAVLTAVFLALGSGVAAAMSQSSQYAAVSPDAVMHGLGAPPPEMTIVSDTTTILNDLDLLAADAGISPRHAESKGLVLTATVDLFFTNDLPQVGINDSAAYVSVPDAGGTSAIALGIDNDHVYTMKYGTVPTAAPADYGGKMTGSQHLVAAQPAEISGGAATPACTRPEGDGIV